MATKSRRARQQQQTQFGPGGTMLAPGGLTGQVPATKTAAIELVVTQHPEWTPTIVAQNINMLWPHFNAKPNEVSTIKSQMKNKAKGGFRTLPKQVGATRVTGASGAYPASRYVDAFRGAEQALVLLGQPPILTLDQAKRVVECITF